MNKEDALPIHIRGALPTDESIIYATWLNSLYCVEPFRRLPKDYFMAAHHALIQSLLTRSQVLIACDPNDPDQIYGYCVCSLGDGVLHWIFTKKDFRRFKVAQRLRDKLGDREITCTQQTPAMKAIAEKWEVYFDLSLLRTAK